jgi:hypothetical protein
MENSSMSLAAWYLHKVDQCARLASDVTEPRERARFKAERRSWLQILAKEIEADEGTLRAVAAMMPPARSDPASRRPMGERASPVRAGA